MGNMYVFAASLWVLSQEFCGRYGQILWVLSCEFMAVLTQKLSALSKTCAQDRVKTFPY